VLKVKRDWVKEGAVVIDVGIRQEGEKIAGDVEDVVGKASYVTPVPGGVGPLTVSMLVRNVVNLWLSQHSIKDRVH
jgi:5,10-methylene-tetrahydrofolate dehydrogenase/methenyl tetrahydrofolate cyclohydrolase